MGTLYNWIRYKTNAAAGGAIDFDALRKTAVENKPKMIVCGFSSYPRNLDYAQFKSIADEVGALPWGAGCDDEALTEAGLVALSSAGTYVQDLDRLAPGAVNVPAVPVRIGGAVAPAQIDTGYDDTLVGPAININRAFFENVDSEALVRAPELDIVLTTCVPGVVEAVQAWRMRAGEAVELIGEAGDAARRYPDAIAFLKDTPAAARQCGGIGTWSEPGAQLGVSFVARGGRAVFDPWSSRVWVTASE
jgi:hypothetical protein